MNPASASNAAPSTSRRISAPAATRQSGDRSTPDEYRLPYANTRQRTGRSPRSEASLLPPTSRGGTRPRRRLHGRPSGQNQRPPACVSAGQEATIHTVRRALQGNKKPAALQRSRIDLFIIANWRLGARAAGDGSLSAQETVSLCLTDRRGALVYGDGEGNRGRSSSVPRPTNAWIDEQPDQSRGTRKSTERSAGSRRKPSPQEGRNGPPPVLRPADKGQQPGQPVWTMWVATS